MCRLTVVNKLYLGNRELGYELYNDKEVVELTAIQLKMQSRQVRTLEE